MVSSIAARSKDTLAENCRQFADCAYQRGAGTRWYISADFRNIQDTWIPEITLR